MKKAGAIIRVSTTKQLEGTSPEKQREVILNLAEKQGFKLDENDIWALAESGYSRERLGFQNALQASSEGEISRLYVYSIDRLGRDLLEMLMFLRQLEDYGIECWCAEKEERLDSSDFLLQIQGAVASKERQEIIKRTQDGLRRAIKAGKYSGGIIPYGYQLNSSSKKLEICEEEAQIIRMIFNWVVEEGISCVVISERLNALGIPTRYAKSGILVRQKGKRDPEHTAGIWRAGRVLNMIKNPCYAGVWTWGKRSKKGSRQEKIPGFAPPLIDDELFDEANKKIRLNRLIDPSTPHRNYLLRGFIRCAKCGKVYCGSYSKVAPSGSREKRYYRCNGKTQWRKLGCPKCDSLSLNAEEIEQVVWNDIMIFCKDPSIAINQLIEQRKPIEAAIPDQVEQVRIQISEIERKEVNVLRLAAESHEINPDNVDQVLSEYKENKRVLNRYLETLLLEQNQSKHLESQLRDISERLSELFERIDNASDSEKRAAVVELVKGITVSTEIFQGKKTAVVTITYKFNEPCQTTPPDTPVIINCTPARAVTTAIPPAPAPARPASSLSTSAVSPAR